MGQKVNPNILRLGVNKTWKTKFFEKKIQELPLYTFKDLEIKSYIERFLEKHGFILHDHKQHYSNSTLNLYVSYFITSDFNLKKNDTQKLMFVNKSGDKKRVQSVNNSLNAFIKPSGERISSTHFYKIKKYLKLNRYNDLQKLMRNNLHPMVNQQSFEMTNKLKIRSVFDQLFKVLNLFTNNKLNIVINFCCINKDLTFLKFSQTKKFSLLQKFRNTPFLKEGIELLFHVVYNKNSANLLVRFIALQLKKIKRQKLFFSFLKQALSILIDSNFSKVKGVKIIVKGRLNGVPRAKHKIISVGDVPVQSINEELDYSQTTVHNSSGSYGIKAWIVGR
uniref:Ribosomal protein S3 n=1 Tax=Cylindrotheca closterium TaxID=2856 RepID=A0A2U9GIZ0_9STRA|nr:ribosomal protein S3 [Cylindrotheca closterium]AWQ64051.1 ribosomal protein S3 [Cylindrotheca closterium]